MQEYYPIPGETERAKAKRSARRLNQGTQKKKKDY